jgi:hypothetical protein
MERFVCGTTGLRLIQSSRLAFETSRQGLSNEFRSHRGWNDAQAAASESQWRSAVARGAVATLYVDMLDVERIKSSKVVEVQLVLAAELLLEPKRFELERRTLQDYGKDLRIDELEAAMSRLEGIARESGAHAGLWRWLQKAAVTMKLYAAAERYEKEFHDALARNV